ncbi:MAG TPA: TPM domain-containing protein, partial [Sphingomicrobium sp.]|nr:TPM domain-containing protein [Sphingomicrobium sp.]
MTKWIVGLVLSLLLLAAPAAAQTFPPLTGRVVDQADLLRPEQELDLTSKLAALEAQTGRQFVVATVRSLEGRTIEDYGYRLGRAWAIGDKERDDGVILLVAPKERKVRVETGYGARVFLTDAASSIIIREDILPRFKAGDMAGGIMAGAERVIATLQLPPEEAARRAEEIGKSARRAEVDVNPVLVFMIVII